MVGMATIHGVSAGSKDGVLDGFLRRLLHITFVLRIARTDAIGTMLLLNLVRSSPLATGP